MSEYTLDLKTDTCLNKRYLIQKKLGSGGFGITYEAYDIQEKQKCAIKEFFPRGIAVRLQDGVTLTPVSTSKEALFNHGMERFLEEAEILQRLNDEPAVVSVYDFFQENGTCYFTMEFLDGMTLDKLTKAQGGRLKYRIVADALEKVGNALIRVHKSNIFHRDISPDNIFITYSGNVKLIDFGNAKNLIRNDNEQLSVVLKPGFAPPEQYSKNGKQGTYTDVYALAGTVYYVLTGEKIPDALERCQRDNYRHLDEYGFEPYISDAIDRALMPSYKKRTQTVEEFLEDMHLKPVKGRPVAASFDRPRAENAGRSAERTDSHGKSTFFSYVEIIRGMEAGKRYRLPENTNVIVGRTGSMSQIVIKNDPYISKTHCVLYFDREKRVFYIKDCSTNGTFLEGKRLERGKLYALRSGSRIILGKGDSIIKVGVMNE